MRSVAKSAFGGKKILIFCLISLVSLIFFSSTVFAALESNSNQEAPAKLKIKLNLFLNAPFDFFYHKRDGIGFNMLGIDLTLLEYKSFRFLGFGVGVGAFTEEKLKWVKYGYYTWTVEDGKLKTIFHVLYEDWLECDDSYISLYFKLCLVKIPLNFTKNMKDNVFFELGIFSQDLKEIHGIAIGFSFSFNIFKNKD